MRKRFIPAVCAVYMSLFIYSCSELVLPKKVEIKGTLNLPVKVGSTNLSSLFAEKIDDAFSGGIQEGSKVYTVDYKGQTVQTFCIYLPIEMTEDLNPNEFLKTIDRQINDGIHTEPKRIDVQIPYLGIPIPIKGINDIVDTIPPISLAAIAQYVKSMTFNKCEGTVDSGIGINFHFTEIPDGLKMVLVCDALKFSSDPKPLVKGDNVFGNEEKLILALAEYKNDSKKLNFDVILQSGGPDPDMLDLSGSGLVSGNMIKIEGEMSFFHEWEEARIDLSAAIKASAKLDDITGKFPDSSFDLSGLNDYLDGGFTFNDLEVKVYMNGPHPETVNMLEANLILEAQCGDSEDELYLYNDILFINSVPINPNDYLDENGYYRERHLPGSSDHDGKMNGDAIAEIFRIMPKDLFFKYSIRMGDDKDLIITPEMFSGDINDSDENNRISIAIMIMLPMSLVAAGNDDDRSIVSLPDILGDGDLFGREGPGDLFSGVDINYVRMTIDISDQIFTKGRLFIDEDRDLFPQGIKLNGKKIALNFTDREFKIIQEKLISPNIAIEIDNGGTVNIPKTMGIVNINLEIKGLIKVGEL
ncbi:MAG: hypothetical protein LBH20_01175 [Treponema sp.]|jgi:hypothetical protein|nr:hypothetical protein [Treponema sp.]